MSQRRRLNQAGGLVTPARLRGDTTAHDLCNVIGALRLRFGVLESDPTCRWAQEENLTAIRRLLDQGMQLARTLEIAAAALPQTAPPRAEARDAPARQHRAVTSRRR